MYKQVKDRPELVRNHSNAIINVDNYAYAARQRQKQNADNTAATIASLTEQVAELREIANGLMQMLKEKDNQ